MVITNTGQTHLASLKLDNSAIDYREHSKIPNLAPNEKHVMWAEREIKATIVSTASVTGNPIFHDGRDLVDLVDVVDTDPSEVALLSHEPNLSVSVTVYAGNDDGASCGTSRAKDAVEDFLGEFPKFYSAACANFRLAGTAVVYCFAFHNTGNTHLTKIRFVNDALKFSKTVEGNFAPGTTHLVAFPSTITADLKSTLVVSGHPVNDGGEAITGSVDVVGSSSANVKGIQYTPGLTVANTVSVRFAKQTMAHHYIQVYVGDENAEDCKTKGVEFAEAKIGSKAVYCWIVTNTGNTYLKGISLRNKVLDFDQRSILSSPLAPGDSITVTTTGIITRRVQNIVDAVAEPCTKSGSDLPFLDVAASDTSEVGPTPMKPSIVIENTVRNCTRVLL
jgi:hypothetical protein